MIWRVGKRTITKFLADSGPFLAAGLAFNLLLYCMPLALLAVSGLGYTLASSDTALAWVHQALQYFVPRQTDIFEALSAIIENRGLFGISGFALYVILSSSLFAAIRVVLNQVFRVKRVRPFVRGVLVDLSMMLAVAAIVIGHIWIGILVALARTAGEQLPYVAPLVTQLGWVSTYALSIVFTTVLFYVLYRFSPAHRLSRAANVVAALTATALFELSKGVFALYVSHAGASAAIYGALGGLIFFFLWLYYGSVVFVLGAEAGWAYDEAQER